MKPKILTVLFLFAALLIAAAASAEDRLGVPVYPGAKFDKTRTDQLKRSMAVRGAAYRTGDELAKVVAFYKKHGLLLLKLGGSTKEVARLKKADADVDVVVQNPWKDRKTGATMTDTLILIFKREEKEGQDPDLSI